jgi:hypothetical protein
MAPSRPANRIASEVHADDPQLMGRSRTAQRDR